MGTRCASILVTVAENTPVTVYRIERVLTYMAASSIGLAIISILALLIAGVARVDISEGAWPTVFVLPPIGLTLGLLFAIAFIIASAIRRTRAARDAAN
jgi:fucose permease